MQSCPSLNGRSATVSDLAHSQPAGRRSGEGTSTVLPFLRDDAARRPKRPGKHPGITTGRDSEQFSVPRNPRKIGKYLVSPLIKVLENGWFASSVSIRSGSGSGTTDRVLRLTRIFGCAEEAAVYAHAEALRWIGDDRGPRLATCT
jgi:hypothetical protein